MTARTIAIALLVLGCSAPLPQHSEAGANAPQDAAPADAWAPDDAAPYEPDAGHGGGADAGRDAGAPPDAGRPDAGPRPDAGHDAGAACEPVTQAGCYTGQACRLSVVGGREPGIGPAECGRSGVRREGEPCVGADDCRAGLFCWTVCRRYCDPRADACPDRDGSAQMCDGETLLAGSGLGHCVMRR